MNLVLKIERKDKSEKITSNKKKNFYDGDHSEIVHIETSEDEHGKYIDPNDGNTSTDDIAIAEQSTPESLVTLQDSIFSSDPAKWEINAELIRYFTEHSPSQNVESGFIFSCRMFGNKKRYARKEYSTRTLANGERVIRDWLIYSTSIGKVFLLYV